jgi:hypothetical protein
MRISASVCFKRIFPPLLFLILLAQLRFILVVHQVPSGHETELQWYYYHSPLHDAVAVVANHSAGSNSHQTPTKSRFAYAFLIAGCDPINDPSYRGFLYNVLVSRHVLDMEGSKGDVVLLVRMKNMTLASSLPAEEERWLRESGIRSVYLPPPSTGDSFYSAMMAKFYILNLTEYSRVMYLDADVMPLCNLDYMFELSEQGVLKENLIVSWWSGPSLGAIFMLQPGVGEYQKLNKIVSLQQTKAAKNWPPFDEEQGWGHKIELPDEWFAFKHQHGTRWNFQVRYGLTF